MQFFESVSLLRYPGGKTRLLKQLWPYIEASITADHYAEPFAGGGSTFLHVARRRPKLKISINDKDADVATFWSVVSGRDVDFNRLCAGVIQSRGPTDDPLQRLDYWHTIRDSKPNDPALAAFRFLFLNKTCWGGQLDSSPIGGYQQNGWRGRDDRGLACHYTVETILSNLHEARRLLAGRTTVTNLDMFDFLSVVEEASFYLDPPYFPNQVNRLYRQGMSPAEHQRLAEVLREFPHPWVLSYDNSSAVRELYGWANMVEIAMRSSHRSGRKNWKTKVELLILPASHNRERIRHYHRTSIPHALTALSSYGVMEANNASRKENMNANKKKMNGAKASASGTDHVREPSLAQSNVNHSAALTLTTLDQLLGGRRKLSPDEKVKLLDQINVLRLGPLNTEQAAEALGGIADSGAFLCFGGEWRDFFERALGWPEAEGLRIKKLYEERRWDEIGSSSPTSKSAPIKLKVKRSGKANPTQPAQPEAPSADTCQSASEKESDCTISGDQVMDAVPDQSDAEPGEPVPVPQHNHDPKEPPVTTKREISTNGVPPVEVPLATLDGKHAIQCREKLNEKQLKQYVERMFAKDQFPPVEAYRVKGVLCLTDGFHRLKAAQQTGQQTIWCIIREGTRTDAIRAAIKANSDHGLPRTNADKRRAATLAIESFPKYSDHQLAELCHVSHTFIAKIRRELATDSSCEPRVGRDGKRRKMPKTSNAKGAKMEQDAETPTEGTQDNGISSADSEENHESSHEQKTNGIKTGQDQPENPSDTEDSGVREDAVSEACDLIEAFVQEQIAGFSSTEKARVAEELRALADRITE